MSFDLDEKYLVEAEEKLGVSLPPTYRAAMIQKNGGEVKVAGDRWQLIPILDKSDRKRLARTCNDIVRETNEKTKWAGWSEGAICLAENGTGDALVFLTGDKVCDAAVHCWRHETGATCKVAKDFADLAR
ncbi:SMI1/KNR4 family protein [Pseudorhodobacter ferrugineus]|uniref:SMI1/KNR4 family protein n=1 Tax=Pseudorhodobacter ferrugineus TaxID=77008 RepID=UPI0003B3EF63|nr:SMI1/KNR4 family protein [Pseudorhodobacter ferrugineus]